jgi:hypothetical protein
MKVENAYCRDMYIVGACIIRLSLCLLLLLPPVSKGQSKRCHDAKSSSDNVTEGDWDEVFQEHLRDRDFSSAKDAQWDDEHVGDAVQIRKKK